MSIDKELFTATPLPIKKLFGDSDSYYQIPKYQRPYQWVDTQLVALWSDIEDAFYEDPDKAYFLGPIITTDPKENEYHQDVVDGQQRITTLMILFCVIRDLYPTVNKDNEHTNVIQIEDVVDCISKKAQRLRFLTQSVDQRNFMECILNENSTKPHKKPDTKCLAKDQDPKFKFINSAYFFKEKLNELNESLDDFINFLFNKVVVIVINCDNVSSAIKLFQVINTRGLDLTHADLTKSFLLERITNDRNIEPHNIILNEAQFQSDWNTIVEHIKQPENDIHMDDLLSIYQYYSQAKEHGKTLYTKLEKFFKYQFNPESDERLDSPQTPNDAIAEIRSFSEYYLELCNENKNKEIFSLRYTPWSMLWKSILLTAIYTNYEHIDELRKELRKFYYLHWIAGKNLSHVKSPSFKIIRQIKKNVSIKDMFEDAYKDSKYNEENLINEVSKKLQATDIASERWCKQLLLLIEYATKEEDSQYYIKLDNSIHLEHVIPIKSHDGWEHITDEVRDKYLNSAGNLTLLKGKKNSAASNKPFREKMEFYEGSEDTKITSFNISRDILDVYRNGQKWDETAMKDRKEWFIKEVGKVLGIKINLESDS